jgi:phage terminase large subunit-like protein
LNLQELQNQPKAVLLDVIAALDALEAKQKYNKIASVFPDAGPYRKELYPKHMEFMERGSNHKIRAFLAGNRIGKSFTGAVETVYHLTGLYPKDWKGRRYNRPIKAWACARENKQLREGIQELLFGDFADKGTGLIPKDCLINDQGEMQTWAMAGTANCVGTVRSKWYNPEGQFIGWSTCDFKTYAQGWQEFQGAKRDWIWLDEEPDDAKIYTECLTRTSGAGEEDGSLICTFTPLLGYSSVYLGFVPNGILLKMEYIQRILINL